MPESIDYYISLISPWTYLGHERFVAICRQAGLQIQVRPVDFATVFPATGGLPLPKRAPARQAYRMMELRRWREYLQIPLTLEPKFFPADETLAAGLVGAVRAQGGDAVSLAGAILRAVWVEEQDISDPSALRAIVAGEGLDEALVAAAEGPDATARRTADTERALSQGVFGAPTYAIDGELFWGQDRLDFVERRLTAGD